MAVYRVEQREALGEQLGNWAGEEIAIVGAGEAMQVSRERPHQGARRTPSQATRSMGLKRARARARASRTSGRSASFSRSTARKGMVGFAQGGGDGREGSAGAAKNGDAVLFSARFCLQDAVLMALDESDDLGGLCVVSGIRCRRILARPAWGTNSEMEIEVRAGIGLGWIGFAVARRFGR